MAVVLGSCPTKSRLITLDELLTQYLVLSLGLTQQDLQVADVHLVLLAKLFGAGGGVEYCP